MTNDHASGTELFAIGFATVVTFVFVGMIGWEYVRNAQPAVLEAVDTVATLSIKAVVLAAVVWIFYWFCKGLGWILLWTTR